MRMRIARGQLRRPRTASVASHQPQQHLHATTVRVNGSIFSPSSVPGVLQLGWAAHIFHLTGYA